MNIGIIRDPRTLRGIAEEWNELVLSSENPNIFLTMEWIATWWNHFAEGKRLFVVVARERRDLVAVLPAWWGSISLHREVDLPGAGRIRDRGTSMLGIRNRGLCLIGDGGPVSPEYLGPIVRKGYARTVTEPMLRTALDAVKEWSVVRFSDLPVDSESTCIMAGFFRNKHLLQDFAGERCWYQSLPSKYSTFLDQFSRKHRYNLRRMTKLAEDEFQVTLEKVTEESKIQMAFSDLFKIHNRSERGMRGEGKWHDLSYMEFHKQLATQFAKKGWLRIYILRFNGAPVAFTYSFLFTNRFSFYQTSYDREYREYSPGSIILQKTIENAINDGAKVFDYLRGEYEYKSILTENFRQQKNLIVFRSRGVNSFAFVSLRRCMRILGDISRRGPKTRRIIEWSRKKTKSL